MIQKQWSLSQFLNYYVHVSAQFLQTNDLVVVQFCDQNCLAGRFSQEGSRDSKSVFQSSWSSSNKHGAIHNELLNTDNCTHFRLMNESISYLHPLIN